MIFFKNNQENFKPSFFIAFLCGVTYKRDSIEDKRNVLYDFLNIVPTITIKNMSIKASNPRFQSITESTVISIK